MTTRDVAPSVWQKRRLRIAQQRAARADQQAARARDRARAAEPEEEDEEEDDAPRTKRRTAPARRGGARSAKPSAIVGRATLKQQRSVIERVMAWLILLLSFLGTIAALHGGFTPLISSVTVGPLNRAALMGGILIQLLLTFLEWYYFDIPLIAWGARIVDTAMTVIGYGPLLIAPLIVLLYNRNVPSPELVAWVVIMLASLGVAWFPESRLVD